MCVCVCVLIVPHIFDRPSPPPLHCLKSGKSFYLPFCCVEMPLCAHSCGVRSQVRRRQSSFCNSRANLPDPPSFRDWFERHIRSPGSMNCLQVRLHLQKTTSSPQTYAQNQNGNLRAVMRSLVSSCPASAPGFLCPLTQNHGETVSQVGSASGSQFLSQF